MLAAKAAGEPGVRLTRDQDFDENGLFYWLGTNGGREREWINPGTIGIVSLSSSSDQSLPFGRLEHVLSRADQPHNCHTKDEPAGAWFGVDLGVSLVPAHYTLRHARGYAQSALRHWALQVSYVKVFYLYL